MSNARNLARLARIGAPQFGTVQDVRGMGVYGGIVPETVVTLGCTSEGDGGGRRWTWDPAATDADDTGTTLKIASVATGRYRAVMESSVVLPEWFGAVADGIGGNGLFNPAATGNADALQAALDYAGSKYPVFVSGPFMLEKEILPPRGALIVGSGSAYNFSGKRGQTHVICGFDTGGSNGALFRCNNYDGGAVEFKDINIDMNQKSVWAISVSDTTKTDLSRAQLKINNVRIISCGGNGIWMGNYTNPSEIRGLILRGSDQWLLNGTSENADGIVPDSIGLENNGADLHMYGCEFAGGFHTGFWQKNNNASITNNFFDQNIVNVVDQGDQNTYSSNRFQYAYGAPFGSTYVGAGMIVGGVASSSPGKVTVLVGNAFSRNNSTKSMSLLPGADIAAGNADGCGLLLRHALQPVVVGNVFAYQDVGWKAEDAQQATIANNSFRYVRKEFEVPTGAFQEGIITDIRGARKYDGAGNPTAGLNIKADYIEIENGGLKVDGPVNAVRYQYIGSATSVSRSILDASWFDVRFSASGQTLTLTDTKAFEARGSIVAVQNTGTEEFTLAIDGGNVREISNLSTPTIAIPVKARRLFIVQNGTLWAYIEA